MEYEKKDLEQIIYGCCSELLSDQPMLFKRKENINERTISGELSSKISAQIKEFHINCEYNRMTDEHGVQIPKRIHLDPNSEDPSSVYPDIIIHRQEDGEHNLLIIEIKMAWKNGKKDHDIQKLQRYINELKYKHGLYLELGEKGISDLVWFP